MMEMKRSTISNGDGNLQCATITHIDKFNLAGSPDFVKYIVSVEGGLDVSKVGEGVFHFGDIEFFLT